MRSLLLSVLVSFNLVACVTGDNDLAEDMPTGEITAAQADDLIDTDVSAEDAQLRPSREMPDTGAAIEQAGQLPRFEKDVATAQLGDDELADLGQNGMKRPVREHETRHETSGPALQQDGQLPKLEQDVAYDADLTDEEWLELVKQGRQVDKNLPALR